MEYCSKIYGLGFTHRLQDRKFYKLDYCNNNNMNPSDP